MFESAMVAHRPAGLLTHAAPWGRHPAYAPWVQALMPGSSAGDVGRTGYTHLAARGLVPRDLHVESAALRTGCKGGGVRLALIGGAPGLGMRGLLGDPGHSAVSKSTAIAAPAGTAALTTFCTLRRRMRAATCRGRRSVCCHLSCPAALLTRRIAACRSGSRHTGTARAGQCCHWRCMGAAGQWGQRM